MTAGHFAIGLPRSRLLRAVSCGLLALALVPAAPAQAGLGDCVAAALPLEDAARAAELAGKLSACAGQASDPVAAVVAATIVALVTAGVIPADTQQCDAVLNSVIGQLVAQALIAAGLGDAFGQAVVDLANGVGGVTDVPGLGELLSCGCTIAGAPGEAKKIAEDYLESAEGCAEFFADAGEAVLNWLEDGVCAVLSIFGGCSAAGGGDPNCYYSIQCPTGNCPNALPGYQGAVGGPACSSAGSQCNACGNWGYCASIPHGIGVIPGRCTCEPPYTGKYLKTVTGYFGAPREANWLYECACDPPNISANGQCYCPSHMTLESGVCVSCKDDEIYAGHGCAHCYMMGSKPDAAHEKCVPACDATKGEYFTSNTCQQCPAGSHVVYSNPTETSMGHCEATCKPGQVFVSGILQMGTNNATPDSCYTCPKNTHAVYAKAGASAGKCEGCPDYTVWAASLQTCVPLECGPSAYADVDDKHSCKHCPPGQYYFPPEIVSVEGATQNDNKVEKIPGHCGCPEGTKQVGDTCQCAAGTIKLFDTGCICPAGAHVDQASFSCQCAAGATLDSTGTTCVCPPSLHIEGDKCVPKILEQHDFAPKTSGALAKPVIPCPPRTTPNAAATACLPILDMPDFGAPGSLPSVRGRGVPGRSPTGAAAPSGVGPSTGGPAGAAPSTSPTSR